MASTMFQTVFSYLHFVVLAYICAKAMRVLQFYVLYSSDLSQYKPPSGAGGGPPWALVTGASDGIGKAFAQDLCRRGFNVIIHGRNEEKLRRVAAELGKAHPTREIRLLVIDATMMAASCWTDETDKMVLDVVDGLELTILINNVGGAGVAPRRAWATVTQRSASELDALINLNARFMTQMTRLLIPVLARGRGNKEDLLMRQRRQRRQRRHRAAIVNVSSGAELLPAPYLVAYSAAKAYVSRWSISLDAELRGEGLEIDVHSLIVGAVATMNAGQDGLMAGLFCPDAETFATKALAKLGCGHVVCTPYWPHGLQVAVMACLPEWLGAKFMRDTARRAMARMEKAQ
ncbi:putative short chain dehydrogenase/reductase [Cladophialophora carrionii]|uniref:Putative short chain dehydrogenase/reductase n=1 Tax=Cladophialophora carrionii TaxID=86049 RepID=A0A1C1CXN6_9EURO|nr:putative short chain dehydrogenase/reductase [Cladophialophora carrionii]